ncbi:MAG: response regulator transcription factor [Dehalococcoidia bacterium]
MAPWVAHPFRMPQGGSSCHNPPDLPSLCPSISLPNYKPTPERLHTWGRALLAAGRAHDACAQLAAALAIYAGHDAGAIWLERVRADIERVEALTGGRAPAPPPRYPDGLSEREVAVLRLLAPGKSNQEIADALAISYHTVARHVRHIFEKTGAANRTEAASYAHQHGLSAQPL